MSAKPAAAHFANASALLAEVVRECWRQLGQEMQAGVAAADAQSPLAVLKLQMAAYVRHAMERPSRYQLLFALEPMDPSAPIGLPGTVQPAYCSVLASIEQLATEGAVC